MTIGDFARATRLTAKALRHYHEQGVLVPASVDPRTGYRHYAPDQVADGQVVRLLRELDLPLDDVRAVLAAPDVGARAALVAEHLERVETALARTRATVRSLRAVLDPAPAPITVSHRSVPEAAVVAISETIDLAELGAWFDDGVAELSRVVGSPAPGRDGPFGGVWSTELFVDGRGQATLYAPARQLPPATEGPSRVRPQLLPPVELAVATHRGPDDGVARVYAALGEYVARHELGVDGPVREVYLEGLPGDEHAVTEIGWPIFRIAR